MADEDQATPPAPKANAKLDAIVDGWFNGFSNGPLGRNTQCWNVVHEALADLKSRLAKEG